MVANMVKENGEEMKTKKEMLRKIMILSIFMCATTAFIMINSLFIEDVLWLKITILLMGMAVIALTINNYSQCKILGEMIDFIDKIIGEIKKSVMK